MSTVEHNQISGGAPKPTRGGRLPYHPALDGIRGISLVAVLLFHHDHDLAPGAWGGVSTFFTLSGFLITWLLLIEHRETGTISLRAFYARRARRLLPALAVALAGVIAFGVLVADSSQLRNLRGDLFASLGYVANWRFAFSGETYSDLFGNPSPLLHFWTVAIEEQFYLLFPPALLVVLRRVGNDHQKLLRHVAAMIAASTGALMLSGLLDVDRDLVYFGTHTRAAELLIGAALAIAVHAGWTHRLAATLSWAGPLALVLILGVWGTVAQSTDALYLGGFSAYALLSAAVILAATVPGNAVQVLLRAEPLRQLGRISYGTYLFHWPIYQWLTPERTGIDDGALLAIRLAVSIALALVSFHLLETPVRTARALRTSAAPAVISATLAVLLLATVAVTANPPVDELAIARRDADRQQRDVAPPVPPGAIRIATFGDSTALMTGVGLGDWMNGSNHNDLLPRDGGEPGVVGVGGHTQFGCGLFGGGDVTPFRFVGQEKTENCEPWRQEWATAIARRSPDVAIVQIGQWEVVDRKLPGDTTFRAPGDPAFDAALREHIEDAVELLTSQGVAVLWLLAPHIESGTVDGVRPARSHPESDPVRIDRLNQLIAEVIDKHPMAATVDMPAVLERVLPDGEMDTAVRPDLVHFAVEPFHELVADALGAEIVRTYAELTGWEQPLRGDDTPRSD